ncbi:hypothetical protein JCM10908_000890 [Rhodotorula pacifica]|uniref:uncharacterized protein n=1 Tax=Rhodotorula pacifica TaxID=1495444 RepID=UPI0031768E9B
MAALRLRTSSPTKEPWQPFMSPVSPSSASSEVAASPSTSLSDRCRQLAFRLGGSAVQDDEHFHEQPTSPSEGNPNSPSKRRLSLPSSSPSLNGSSPPRGASNHYFGSSGSNGGGGLAPPTPLSPRSHPPTSPDTTHILNEILEEGESGGEPTPRAENGPRGVYSPAQPSSGFAALIGAGNDAPKPGTAVGPTGALGIDYGAGSGAPTSFSGLSGLMPDLQTEEVHLDDDSQAVVEGRVAEIQNLLQEGATWQAVDIWLSEGELLVGPSLHGLDPSRTFSTCWVEPLLRIFSASVVQIGSAHRRRSSVFAHIKPNTPFQLVLRLRTPASLTFPYVVDALQPLQDASLLTRYCPNARASTPGLITVVSSEADGAEMVPLEDLYAVQGERFVYRDASLFALDEDDDAEAGTPVNDDGKRFDPQVTPVAAGELLASTGWDGQGPLTAEIRTRIERQVERAHAAGLKIRYEKLPQFPVHVRENVRSVLQKLGVDYL